MSAIKTQVDRLSEPSLGEQEKQIRSSQRKEDKRKKEEQKQQAEKEIYDKSELIIEQLEIMIQDACYDDALSLFDEVNALVE